MPGTSPRLMSLAAAIAGVLAAPLPAPGAPIPGARGDGTTDDAAVVQAYVDSLPTGSVLDCGGTRWDYLLGTPSRGAFLTLPHAIQVRDCRFTYAGATAATDVIRFAPRNPGEDIDGLGFEDVVFRPRGGALRRHLIDIDLSDSSNQVLRGAWFRYITAYPDPAAVGDEIHYTPAATAESDGGIFSSTFGPRLQLWGCIDLEHAGDSITIEGNQLSYRSPGDTQCAIAVSLVAGAGNLIVRGNNITANGGIVIGNGGFLVNADIAENEIEQANTNTEANQVQLDIGGAGVDTVWVHENQFQSVVSRTTLQLNRVAGIAPGQIVAGNSIPAGCTVLAAGDGNHPWVQLSCLQQGAIAKGASIAIGGAWFTTASAAEAQAHAIRVDHATRTVIRSNRFGESSPSPEITITGRAIDTVVGYGNYYPAMHAHVGDRGTGTAQIGAERSR